MGNLAAVALPAVLGVFALGIVFVVGVAIGGAIVNRELSRRFRSCVAIGAAGLLVGLPFVSALHRDVTNDGPASGYVAFAVGVAGGLWITFSAAHGESGPP